ncbi:hypothetical protein BDR04DRAFT_1233804 [Suillus decipiens]|nr:hypothetical protein BDR04DRAFT_1233804 [Suillus decipiens]
MSKLPSSLERGDKSMCIKAHDMFTSLVFYLVVSVISSVSTGLVMAVQVHPRHPPVTRNVISNANCNDGYSWMNDGDGHTPCLTVAFVEAAYYIQPILNPGYSYSLPNATSGNQCYCSWSSYNLMMACTLCQGANSTWQWPEWASGCTNQSWTEEYFPSGYVLSGGATIPAWAATNPTTWTYSTFNIPDADATYQKNSSYITPGASPSSSGSSSSSSSSSTSSSTSDVGGIVGGTIGALAALSLFAVGAYLVYRRHVYKKAVYATVINQQPFVDRSDGTATRMTHDRFPSGSSNFSHSFGSPAAVQYGQSSSPSQYGIVYAPQPQTAYPSFPGSFSPPPRTDTSFNTTHTRQHSDAIPMV